MGKVCLRTGREKESAAYLQKGDGAETESGPKLDLPVHEKPSLRLGKSAFCKAQWKSPTK